MGVCLSIAEKMDPVLSSVETIGKCLVVPIGKLVGKQVGYQIYYNSNIRSLKDQSQKLADKRNDLQRVVDAATRNGQVISSEVESWWTNADKLNEGLGRFLEEDVEANSMHVHGWCPNLKLSYSLSRKAKKKTEAIVELLGNGKFNIPVSIPAPPPDIVSSSIEGFKDFESRTSIRREVLEALKDDNINMIALCGMGGIGKTTMAKEVAKRVKEDHLFDEVAMAVVSQNPNSEKIQGELADMLGLTLTAQSLSGRAQQLYSRIMNGKRILVIVDDVWEGLNLGDIGIPHGGEHKLCKILLTSRSQEACNEMRTQKLFPIEVLSEEEAWNLFREMAGSCIDDNPDLHPIAKKVTKECGGLPVAIVTVGRALEDRNKDEWIAALQQLEKSFPENIPGLHSKVYSSIELSYSYLKSNEAKSCFLLCCLFPEDYDIPIEYLVRYGVGRRLFAKIDTVAEARIRVHALVQNLRRSFLLIDSEEEECVKMHDVVRDAAISIASKDEQGFLVRCDDKLEEWPEEDAYKRYVAISLVVEDLQKYPDGLECPKLELLQQSSNTSVWYEGKELQTSFPANYFVGMNALKVLTLRRMSFQSLPSSIQALQNLRMLNLDYCELRGDVSAIGKLEKLEILSFFRSQMKELPREIGHLKHLRLLDLRDCTSLKRIPRGVLSGLSQLEELYMRNSFEDWESTEGMQVGTNASLAELVPVSHRLMALEIQVPNANKLWPKDLLFKNQMIRFKISSSTDYRVDGDAYLFQNSLELNGDIENNSALLQLLEKSDVLNLKGTENLRDILYQKGFPCLKVLSVSCCKSVEYMIDATSEMTSQATFPLLESLKIHEMEKLKEIYHGQLPERSFRSEQTFPHKSMTYLQNGQPAQLASFGNLRSIYLSYCKHLKNVFSLSIATGLIQLQHLSLEMCDEMEEVLSKETAEDEKAGDTLNLPQLKILNLTNLDSLFGFCKAINAVELPQSSHVKATQSSFNVQEVGSGSNELITSQMGKMTDIQYEQHHIGSFPKSRSMPLKLFSSKSVRWAPNLEVLELQSCGSLEVIFDLEGLKLDKDGHAIAAVLAPLRTLSLIDLGNLTHVWKNIPRGIQGFQNLTIICLVDCHKLRYLFSPSIAKLLAELKVVGIRACNEMQNIVQRGQDDGEKDATNINIVFPKVSSFKLELPNFVSFCDFNVYSFEWPSMKILHLNKCPKLKTFGSETNIRLDSTTQEPNGFDSSPIRHFPGFLCRCLECVPRRKNNNRMVGSDRGTTKKFRGSSSLKGTDQPDFHGQTMHHPVNKEEKPSMSDENNQTKIWYCFPSNLIGGLQNLEKFEANWCDSLEAIFQLEGLDVEKSHDFKALNNLTKLVLKHLPKLVYIWKKGPEEITSFQNLRLLEVCDCNSLTCLFSPAIAKLLVKLEEIKVENCHKMKRILAEPGEEEKKDVIVFTQVDSLSLKNLPELECFCSEANAFAWPSLEEIRVFACPKLKTFVLTETETPKLKGVSIDTNSTVRQWVGGLNATIQHIFKVKEEEEEKKKENPLDPCHIQEPKVDPETRPQEQTDDSEEEHSDDDFEEEFERWYDPILDRYDSDG